MLTIHARAENRPEFTSLRAIDREALHEVELGVERLHRAHGYLVAFHHNIGRSTDHFADAERLLRRGGHHALADALRDEHLPRGVVPVDGACDVTAGRWSYDVLETFQRSFLADVLAFGDDAHDRVAGGLRHSFERAQERDWKRRARSE